VEQESLPKSWQMTRLNSEKGIGQGEDENGHQGYDEQETRPTAGMPGAKLFDAFGGQFLIFLVGEDRLVLRSMILEQPAKLAELRDEPDISEKQDDPNTPGDQVESQGSFVHLHQAGEK